MRAASMPGGRLSTAPSSAMKAPPSRSTRLSPGFSEALQLMKPGDRRICLLPYPLAYGEGGKGPIPPKSDLLFEIEMVSVQP